MIVIGIGIVQRSWRVPLKLNHQSQPQYSGLDVCVDGHVRLHRQQ